MNAYSADVPVRTLSPDQKEAIRYFYKPQSGAVLFLIIFLPLLFSLIMGGANNNVPLGIGIGVAIIGLLLLGRRWNSQRKMTRAEFIYEYGSPETVLFQSLGANYGLRVNGQPQPVINLVRGNELLKIKTFDSRIITAFMLPQQTVYTHPKYPNVLVPSGLFSLSRTSSQQVKTRTVGV
ncbi:hypothetical protein [Hymenobacter psoromatis]|uniref:hypothetical protein n=1 Tax=Hymenobacter psoromatis TaxID=1484116 RepID=UPI001CBB48E8|nr:hypothetical protein [Hymenobacter psoromatis]